MSAGHFWGSCEGSSVGSLVIYIIGYLYLRHENPCDLLGATGGQAQASLVCRKG